MLLDTLAWISDNFGLGPCRCWRRRSRSRTSVMFVKCEVPWSSSVNKVWTLDYLGLRPWEAAARWRPRSRSTASHDGDCFQNFLMCLTYFDLILDCGQIRRHVNKKGSQLHNIHKEMFKSRCERWLSLQLRSSRTKPKLSLKVSSDSQLLMLSTKSRLQS